MDHAIVYNILKFIKVFKMGIQTLTSILNGCERVSAMNMFFSHQIQDILLNFLCILQHGEHSYHIHKPIHTP
jgi:hypothetical protein